MIQPAVSIRPNYPEMSFTANVQMEKEPVVETGSKRKATQKPARKKPIRFVFQSFLSNSNMISGNTMKQLTKSMRLHESDHREKRLEMHRSRTIYWPTIQKLYAKRLKSSTEVRVRRLLSRNLPIVIKCRQMTKLSGLKFQQSACRNLKLQ